MATIRGIYSPVRRSRSEDKGQRVLQDVYGFLRISGSASDDEIKADLGQHREMYSMVVNSPDRELATKAELMLKKLGAAEEKLRVTQHVDNSKRTEVSHTNKKTSGRADFSGMLEA